MPEPNSIADNPVQASTFTFTIAVTVHPLASVPVTVYDAGHVTAAAALAGDPCNTRAELFEVQM